MQQISEFAVFTGCSLFACIYLAESMLAFYCLLGMNPVRRMCIHLKKKKWPGSVILSDIYGNSLIVMQSRPCDVCRALNCMQHLFGMTLVSSPVVQYISVIQQCY